jgi:4-amino-4-deoxy-L-arabinose transferase-like glycosyltransferase
MGISKSASSTLRPLFNNDLFLLLFLAAIALLIRIVFFTGMYFDDDPYFAGKAYRLAFKEFQIVAGHYNSLRIGTYFPTVLAYRMFGVGQVSSVLYPLLLSFFSAAILFLFGKRFFNRTTGILAALAYAFYPLDVGLSSRLLPDPILPAISLFAVYLLFSADKKNLDAPQPTLECRGSYLVAGVLVGYLPTVNMSAFPIVLFFGLYLLFQAPPLRKAWGGRGATRLMLLRWALFGAGFLAVSVAEGLMYLNFLGDFFYKYKATLHHYNVEMNFHPNLCLYPDLMTHLHNCRPAAFGGWESYAAGYHYLALIPLLFFGIAKQRKWYLWILLWFGIVFGYLQFGSSSFTEYRPLHRLPRHLNMVTPAMVLLLAGGFEALRRGKTGRRLFGPALVCLLIASLVVIANRHQDTQADLLPQKAIHSFVQAVSPARIYSTESTVAHQKFLDGYLKTGRYGFLPSAVGLSLDGLVLVGDFRNAPGVVFGTKKYGLPPYWENVYRMDAEDLGGDFDIPANAPNLAYAFLPDAETETPMYRRSWETGSPVQVVAGSGPNSFRKFTAALRSDVAPSFLLEGRMRSTGISIAQPRDLGEYAFPHFKSGTLPDGCSGDENEPGRQPEPQGLLSKYKAVLSSWENHAAGQPSRVLHIVSNLTDEGQDLWLNMGPMDEFSAPAYFRVLVLDPASEDFGKGSPGPLNSFDPSSARCIHVPDTPAKGIALVLVCGDSTDCEFDGAQ